MVRAILLGVACGIASGALLALACGVLALPTDVLGQRYQRAVNACVARVSTIEAHLCLEVRDPDHVRPR